MESDISIQSLVTTLEEARDKYHNGYASPLSDEEYDKLENLLRVADPANPFFVGVGSAVRTEKTALPFTMGSLDQIYDHNIISWLNLWNADTEFTVTAKLDGVSLMLIYDWQGRLNIAYTRGDGFEGQDVTRHLKQIKSFPHNIPNTGKSEVIRAEIIMSKDNFAKLKSLGEDYKNPRNYVAGQMNKKKSTDIFYEHVDVIAYHIFGDNMGKNRMLNQLKDFGFKVPLTTGFNLKTIGIVDFLNDTINQFRSVSPYELDGLVIDVDQKHYREPLKKGELNPSYAKKYKLATSDNVAITTVIEVEWNVSKWGYLKPRIKMEPIDLCGVTIEYTSGFNAAFIEQNKIGPGAVIQMTRSGDVIPYIEKVLVGTYAQMPSQEYHWNDTKVDIIVDDVEDNDEAKILQLMNFFVNLDVASLKVASARSLFAAGLVTAEDVIKATESQLQSIIGNANGSKIFNSIKEKLNPTTIDKLAGAGQFFGRNIGQRRIKPILDKYPNIDDWTYDNLISVDGTGPETAELVSKNLDKFKLFIKNIEGYYTLDDKKQLGNKYANYNVVFTGVRNPEMENVITLYGGKVSSGVSKKTTLLIADSLDSGSSKMKKAKDLGIEIMEYKQALKVFNPDVNIPMNKNKPVVKTEFDEFENIFK